MSDSVRDDEVSITIELSSDKKVSTKPSNLYIIGISLVSFFFSIGINITIKSLVADFTFPAFVFAMNQLGGLFITFYFHTFMKYEPKEILLQEKLLCGLLFAISVPTSLWSLRYNSFTNNQLYKLINIPAIAVCSAVFMGKTYNQKSIGSLALILGFSVFAVGIDSLEFDYGMFPGLMTIIATSSQQLYCQFVSKKYEMDGISFLAYTTPFTVCFAGIISVISIGSRYDEFLIQIVKDGVAVKIMITTLLSLILNLASFSMIAQVSALYMQLMGLSKTIALMGADGYFNDVRFTILKLVGMYGALGSMVLYSYAREVINSPKVIMGICVALFPIIFGLYFLP